MKLRSKKFHGIEVDFDDEDIKEALIGQFNLDDLYLYKDIEDRKLYLTGEIEVWSVLDAVRKILQYNADDKGIPIEERKPILLYITSEGGVVDAGTELIDVILASKTPVYTINLGYWYSMGLLIGLAGHKRIGSKNSKILLHDGSNFTYGSSTKVQDQMEFAKRVDQRNKEYVISRTKVTAKEYAKNARVEWYMFADEAKERGFIDCILGEDCDLDEVI